jgi:hypothetical protein
MSLPEKTPRPGLFSFSKIQEILKNRADIDITNSITQETLKIQIMKNMTMFIFVLISSIFIFYSATDPKVLTKRTYFYMFIILVPIAFGTYFTSKMFDDDDNSSPMKLLYMGIGLILISILGYYYAKASKSTLLFLNSIMSILIVFIIIIGLAIFYYIFSNYLKKQTGGLGFFINLIFYIPCLFTDFVSYIKKEIGLTPNIVFILFILELLLVLTYLFFPKLINIVIKNNKNIIMNEPIYLNQTQTIAQSELFIINKDPYNEEVNKENVDNIIFRNSNYSISFWVYVNTNTSSSESYTEEKNIFNYADGKPKLVYLSDGLNHINKFIVYFTNNDNVPKEQRMYEITAPIQRWNNFVFNYKDSNADLFVNGVLERTFYFGEATPLNGTISDNITVGDENGISGAICNVCYFPNVLTAFEISKTYNLLMNLNPPVFSR